MASIIRQISYNLPVYNNVQRENNVLYATTKYILYDDDLPRSKESTINQRENQRLTSLLSAYLLTKKKK